MKTADNDKSTELSEEALVSLMNQVDRRPAPPEDVERAVYFNTRREWQALQARQAHKVRKVRNYRFLAAAAVIVLAVLITPVFFPLGVVNDELQMLGIVNSQTGTVYVVRDQQRIPLLAASKDGNHSSSKLLPEDSIVTTAGSGVSIAWFAGSTIRVAESSELKLHSAHEIELVSGQVYADIPATSSGVAGSQSLRINTRFGTVEHIGTQFMVSSLPDSIEIKVREGSVNVSNEQRSVVTTAGNQSTLRATDEIDHQPIAVFGDQWRWAEQLAPAFNIEGQQLYEVLKRIGRETGKQIVYESADAERIANTTTMHGSIDEDPAHALEYLLETNDLSWYEQDGTVHLYVGQ